MKLKEYTTEQRVDIGMRLHNLIKHYGVRKCNVKAETGLSWQNVHNISELFSVPHRNTCNAIEGWIAKKEEELKVKK